jgi:hypothetical protein
MDSRSDQSMDRRRWPSLALDRSRISPRFPYTSGELGAFSIFPYETRQSNVAGF